VLVAGGRTYGPFTRLTGKTDLSYGIYIYGWPVQQTLVTLFPEMGGAGLIALSFVIVPLFAFASWHLVEWPALRLKRIDPREFLSRLVST
jgi:peptidoglycan/LPS O-acetylase OafA/YrhL